MPGGGAEMSGSIQLPWQAIPRFIPGTTDVTEYSGKLTALEEKYDCFEKAIYGTLQKSDESNDSYMARHDVHFEELLMQGTTLEEVRAYILLRQSQLSSEDRKKIVVEMGGTLKYDKVCSAIRLLGSRSVLCGFAGAEDSSDQGV